MAQASACAISTYADASYNDLSNALLGVSAAYGARGAVTRNGQATPIPVNGRF
jgi:hypothetical protein